MSTPSVILQKSQIATKALFEELKTKKILFCDGEDSDVFLDAFLNNSSETVLQEGCEISWTSLANEYNDTELLTIASDGSGHFTFDEMLVLIQRDAESEIPNMFAKTGEINIFFVTTHDVFEPPVLVYLQWVSHKEDTPLLRCRMVIQKINSTISTCSPYDVLFFKTTVSKK